MVYSHLQEVQHHLFREGWLEGDASKGDWKDSDEIIAALCYLSSCLSSEIRGLAGIFQQDATATCWCLQTCWQSLQTSTQKCTLACLEEYLPSRSILCKQEPVNTQNSAKLDGSGKSRIPEECRMDGAYSKDFLCCLRSVFWSFTEGDDGESTLGTSALNPT